MSEKSIAGFTTTYNCFEMHYPFVECIEALLGFCDEVSIVDAGSTDGTIETLQQLARRESRIKFEVAPVDFSHPRWAIYQDGYLKAKARANCTADYCWQTDTDEIVAEHDFAKIRALPSVMGNIPLIMLPMIEFWGSLRYVRGDFFSWKPRFSVNDPRITHGIPSNLRCYDDQGHEYPRPFDSDSCNYIYKDTLEDVPIVIPVETDSLKNVSLGSPEHQKLYFEWLDRLPAVYHVSWLDLRRKILHYKTLWRRFHASMYNLNIEDNAANNVMFDKPWSAVSDADIKSKAEQLNALGPRFFHKKMDPHKRGTMIEFDRPIPPSLVRWHENEMRQYAESERSCTAQSPLVSAVIPTFNQAKFIQEAVQSLVRQSYDNIEILVVNDGANDNTDQIVKELSNQYPNRRISLINKSRGGMADAKNFGIRQARGTYVMVMDAEDLVEQDYVSKAVKTMSEKDSNLFFSRVEYRGDKSGTWQPEVYDPYFLRYKNCIPKAALFSRALWSATGGFKTGLPFSEDWDFWLNCSKKDLKPSWSDETLIIDRVYEGLGENLIGPASEGLNQAFVVVCNEDLYSIDEVIEAEERLILGHSAWSWKVDAIQKIHTEQYILNFLAGLRFEGQGSLQEAMHAYGAAAEKSSYKSWQALYRLAMILEKSGNLQPAQELYHSVRSLRPDMGKLLNCKLQHPTAVK